MTNKFPFLFVLWLISVSSVTTFVSIFVFCFLTNTNFTPPQPWGEILGAFITVMFFTGIITGIITEGKRPERIKKMKKSSILFPLWLLWIISMASITIAYLSILYGFITHNPIRLPSKPWDSILIAYLIIMFYVGVATGVITGVKRPKS